MSDQWKNTTGDAAQKVEAGEGPRSPCVFDFGPKHPEHEHIEHQMPDAAMQKHIGEHLVDVVGELFIKQVWGKRKQQRESDPCQLLDQEDGSIGNEHYLDERGNRTGTDSQPTTPGMPVATIKSHCSNLSAVPQCLFTTPERSISLIPHHRNHQYSHYSSVFLPPEDRSSDSFTFLLQTAGKSW